MEDCSTDEQQETLCRLQWSDEYIKRSETLMRQNAIFVWLQWLDQRLHRDSTIPDVFSDVVVPTDARSIDLNLACSLRNPVECLF